MAREHDMSFTRPIWDPNRFPLIDRRNPAKTGSRILGKRPQDAALRFKILVVAACFIGLTILGTFAAKTLG